MSPRIAIIILVILAAIAGGSFYYIYRENNTARIEADFYNQQTIAEKQQRELDAKIKAQEIKEQKIEEKSKEIRSEIEQKIDSGQSAATLTEQEKNFLFNPRQTAETAVEQNP